MFKLLVDYITWNIKKLINFKLVLNMIEKLQQKYYCNEKTVTLTNGGSIYV